MSHIMDKRMGFIGKHIGQELAQRKARNPLILSSQPKDKSEPDFLEAAVWVCVPFKSLFAPVIYLVSKRIKLLGRPGRWFVGVLPGSEFSETFKPCG